MNDFNIVQWCDFVRGVVDSATEERMRNHLQSGPAELRRSVALLERVAEVGRRDAEMEIPEYALRTVKAMGSLRRTRQERKPLRTLMRYLPFEVTFDSLGLPAPAGARYVQSSHRQLTFRAAQFSVDVRLEHEKGPNGTVVVGQLLRHGEDVEPMEEVPVLIRAAERVVGRALTSRFGEFQVEGLPRQSLNLCLLVSREDCIDVPIGVASE